MLHIPGLFVTKGVKMEMEVSCPVNKACKVLGVLKGVMQCRTLGLISMTGLREEYLISRTVLNETNIN